MSDLEVAVSEAIETYHRIASRVRDDLVIENRPRVISKLLAELWALDQDAVVGLAMAALLERASLLERVQS